MLPTRTQKAWRRACARQRISNMLSAIVRRVLDPASGRAFYYNILSRRSQWTRPHLLMGQEPPLYRSWEDSLMCWQAAISIQAWRRALCARRLARSMLAEVYECAWDPSSRRQFFYNTATGESTWQKPLARTLGDYFIPDAEDADEDVQRGAGGGVKRPRVAGDMDEATAATVIQAAARMWLTRRAVQPAAAPMYRRVYDAEYGAYYFYCLSTGRSTVRGRA
jgi:hypothetical protein